MNPHDTGVTDLLRRASDGLTPDVDRVVAGGITRGRTRQRRARIGTAVAGVAVIGVVGGLAAVVPRALDDDGRVADDSVVATEGPRPSPSGDPDVAPPADVLRPLVPPTEMAQQIRSMTGATEVTMVDVDTSGKDLPRLYYATVDGAEVSFGIRWYNNPLVVEDGGDPLAPSHVCEPEVEDDCTTLRDGSRLLREEARPSGGTSVPDPFRERSLTLATADGWPIDVIARNSTGEKDGEVVAPEPVLTMQRMEDLALSEAWYA